MMSMRFGGAIAMMQNNTILVSADRADRAEAATAGSVYVFVIAVDATGNRQVQYQQKLGASDPTDQGHFGSAVATYGQRAVIGARGPDFQAGQMTPSGNGAIYLFDVPTGQQVAKLMPVDAVGNGALGCLWFGAAVALSEDLIVVGAPRARAPCATSSLMGATFVYDVATLTQHAQILPTEDYSELGTAVALCTQADGRHVLLIGAPGHATGSVYASLPFDASDEDSLGSLGTDPAAWAARVTPLTSSSTARFGTALSFEATSRIGLVGAPNMYTAHGADSGSATILRTWMDPSASRLVLPGHAYDLLLYLHP